MNNRTPMRLCDVVLAKAVADGTRARLHDLKLLEVVIGTQRRGASATVLLSGEAPLLGFGEMVAYQSPAVDGVPIAQAVQR